MVDRGSLGPVEQGLVTPNDIQGCTEEEISVLMRAQAVGAIPDSYREFLAYDGRNPYWLSRTGEWDYEWLLEAKEIAREIVVEDYKRDFTPFEDAFIFQTHQGYMFYYFQPDDLTEPDPHFWIYTGKEPVRDGGRRFTEWLQALANDLPRDVELRQRLDLQ